MSPARSSRCQLARLKDLVDLRCSDPLTGVPEVAKTAGVIIETPDLRRWAAHAQTMAEPVA